MEEVNVIDSFEGKYEFLSNMYKAPQESRIFWMERDEDGDENLESALEIFPTLEHAFQTSRTLNRKDQLEIKEAVSAKQARRIAERAENVRGHDLSIMERLLIDKFNQHFYLTCSLLLTNDTKIVFKNNDTFWGINEDGEGLNHLGRLLMKIRSNIFTEEGDIYSLVRYRLDREGLGFIGEWIDPVKMVL